MTTDRLDLDTGELVEAMTRPVTFSRSIAQLAGALAKAQGAMTSAEFDRTNPHFGSRYMSLASLWATIRGPLSANGLSVLQLVSADGLLVSVETLLAHESGEFVQTTLKLTARDVSAQSLGSLVTYLRRYALSALVGVVGDDDDDANAADALKSVKPEKAAKAAEGREASREGGAGRSRPAPAAKVETITREQQTRLFAIATESGWKNNEIKRFLAEHYAYTSSKDIRVADYDRIISDLHGGPEMRIAAADEDERPF